MGNVIELSNLPPAPGGGSWLEYYSGARTLLSEVGGSARAAANFEILVTPVTDDFVAALSSEHIGPDRAWAPVYTSRLQRDRVARVVASRREAHRLVVYPDIEDGDISYCSPEKLADVVACHLRLPRFRSRYLGEMDSPVRAATTLAHLALSAEALGLLKDPISGSLSIE